MYPSGEVSGNAALPHLPGAAQARRALPLAQKIASRVTAILPGFSPDFPPVISHYQGWD
jgi:hypothetical protein